MTKLENILRKHLRSKLKLVTEMEKIILRKLSLELCLLILANMTKLENILRKPIEIGDKIEIGDRNGEASSCGNLGTVFQSVGEYDKAREYLEKALAIRVEIGDKEGEATDYGNLGTVFQSVGDYDKAREYHEKALAIRVEIGDKEGEATDYGNLGTVFQSLGEYDKAREYLEKALAIKIQIGHKKGEASSYGNLGTVFQELCFNPLVTMTKLENIMRKHLRSELKLVSMTKREKQQITET